MFRTKKHKKILEGSKQYENIEICKENGNHLKCKICNTIIKWGGNWKRID